MANDTDVIEKPTTKATESDRTYTRDEIRAAILNAQGDDETVEVFGIQVEVRTPCLEDLLQYRDSEDDDYAMAKAIQRNVYVPGTDELVFGEADIPTLMRTKFTKDMKKLNKAVMRALGADEAIQKGIEDNTKSTKE